MHYLDVHSGSLQVVASVVLVLITAVYTVLTRAMAKAAQEALRPYVYLDVSFISPAQMVVLIGNSGTKVAGNVKATITHANNEGLAKLIRDLPLTTGVGHLAPGSTRKYEVVVNQRDLFPTDGPAPTLEFEFTYHNGRRLISDRQEINLGGYRASLLPGYGDPSYQIRDELRNIAAKLPDRVQVFPPIRKACPYCGTMVVASARKCHACLEWLSGAPGRAPSHRFHTRRHRS